LKSLALVTFVIFFLLQLLCSHTKKPPKSLTLRPQADQEKRSTRISETEYQTEYQRQLGLAITDRPTSINQAVANMGKSNAKADRMAQKGEAALAKQKEKDRRREEEEAARWEAGAKKAGRK